MVECLSSICETLGSTPSKYHKEEEEDGEEEKEEEKWEIFFKNKQKELAHQAGGYSKQTEQQTQKSKDLD